MKKNLKQVLEVLKQENRIRLSLNERLQNSGYDTVETSFFEPYEGFIQCRGRSPKGKTVKVVNNKGEIEILRPDMTFNIMKMIAADYEMDSKIKLSYDSTIFENDLKLGIVEKRQIGAEYFGELSIDADVEVINLARETLSKLNQSVLVIGHTRFINGLLDALECSEANRNQIMIALYKKQPDDLKRALDILNVTKELRSKIEMLLDLENYPLERYSEGYMNGDMKIALREMLYLESIFDEKVSFDMSLISMFDYYNGIIFKGYGKGINQAILKGGRYDRLSELFDRTIPAVGFSLEFKDYMKLVRL